MSHNSSITYRPEIDGLRTLAVLPVIFYHFHMLQDYTLGGFGGVDVFFVISGFLVNSIIISDILKSKFSFAVFYQRRVRRLFPAMFALFITLLSVGLFLYYQKNMYQELISEVKYALLSIINFHFYSRFDASDGYWGIQAKTWPLLHFWSLAVQQQFYMITPILLNLLSKIVKNEIFLIFSFLLYCIIIGISFALSIIYTQSIPMLAFYLIICRAWQLGLGAILAIILHYRSINAIKEFLKFYLGRQTIFQYQIFNRLTLEIVSWSGLGMILWSYVYFNDENDVFPGYKALMPCVGAFLFIGANFVRFQQVNEQTLKQTNIQAPSQTQNLQRIQMQQQLSLDTTKQTQFSSRQIILSSAKVLSLKPIVWIGKISYPLYLWHWPIWLFNIYYLSEIGLQVSSFNKYYMLILTFMIAIISTFFIEDPFRDKKIVSKKLLWLFFIICWIGMMAYLLMASKFQIGGIKQNINDENSHQNISQSAHFLYPIKDSEGQSILNYYMNFDIQLINVEIINKTPQYRIIHNYNAFKEYDMSFHSSFVNINEQNQSKSDNACVMTIGNSHTRQHSLTMSELAQQYNLSLVISVHSGQPLQQKDSDYNKWKIKQIQLFKPKIIFAQQHWPYYKTKNKKSIKEIIQNILNPILSVQEPPQLIVLFGDNPIINVDLNVKMSSFTQYLKKRYISQGKYSWSFLKDIHTVNLDQQIQIEKQVDRVIQENYDTSIVKFYPHLHQFLQNPYSGSFQLFGSQFDGQYLYMDGDHLSIYGAKRFKKYIESKVFTKGKELCKNIN